MNQVLYDKFDCSCCKSINIFIMGAVKLDPEFTYFLILQEIRQVYKNIVISNNIETIVIISRYPHILMLTLFDLISGVEPVEKLPVPNLKLVAD